MTDAAASQSKPDDDPQPAQRKRRRRRKLALGALALIFLAGGAGYGGYWYFVGRFWVSTADAYVHGNQIPLMAQVAGTVYAIAVDDTEQVHKGEVLVRLDPTDARLALDRAEAQLAQTVRQVHQLYQQTAEQKATVALRKADLDQARRDYARAKRLQRSHNVSEQRYQHARTAREAARASLSQARHQLAALQAVTQGTELRDHPRVKLAVAALRQAYINLQRTRVLAPVDGYVAQRKVQVGQRVQPGQPLLAIVPLKQLWVAANFKETALAHMRVGQPVTMTADFYGSEVHYRGTVLGINPGTGSAFELLPPQNATGNWIKVVRRLPVRIALEPAELKTHPLRLGLSMQVNVNVHDTDGPVLGEAARGQTDYSTDVYRRNPTRLNRLVDDIIRANAGPSAGTLADRSHGR
jgi:membrane fusion protein (multidrug efflux system)